MATYERFEVFMPVAMKNAFFWDVTTCGSCKNGRFGGTVQLLVTVDIVPSSLILSALMTENIISSESSVLTRAKRRHNTEDILHRHILCAGRILPWPAMVRPRNGNWTGDLKTGIPRMYVGL
jgi:hypothetical protein